MGPPGEYRIRCTCGTVAEGPRRSRPQTVSCLGCKRPLFVFPKGALGAKPPPPPRLSWRVPLIAAISCAALIAAAFVLLWPFLSRHAAETTAPPNIEECLTAGEKLLGLGRFHLARAELDTAAARFKPETLEPITARRLVQLRRQADALAQLSLLSLEEIVRQARFVRDPEEWAAQWREDHLGRTLIFDDALRRDLEGRPVLVNHRIRVDEDSVLGALDFGF